MLSLFGSRQTLSRDGLPGTLEKTKPVSAERCGNVLKLGSDWTRKELLAVTTRILNELEGCCIYPSAYQRLENPAQQGRHARRTHTALTADTGTIDVIVTRESWTRKARRAKLQTTDTTPASNPQASVAGPLCHLQAYVSRRQQAIALQDLELPGHNKEAEAALEALGTEAFDLVKVTWRIPSTTAQAEQQADDSDEESTNHTALALKAAAKRKRENPDDEPSQHLELVVQYHDLQSDRLVDETRPSGLSSSFEDPSENDVEGAIEGLRKPYGTVRVQLLEYAPELETRQRRAPGISKADLKALRPTITRREDLEQMYAREDDGESLDMDQAFQRIAKRVWSQLRGKSSVR